MQLAGQFPSFPLPSSRMHLHWKSRNRSVTPEFRAVGHGARRGHVWAGGCCVGWVPGWVLLFLELPDVSIYSVYLYEVERFHSHRREIRVDGLDLNQRVMSLKMGMACSSCPINGLW
ncbi:hypothetical protein VTI74DRAFT_7379 [Chaetomium olivicolor]